MNQEENKRLLKLYEQGLTSSEEEAILIKTFGNSKDEEHVWFKFLKNHKRKTPTNLESHIWTNIQRKDSKKPKMVLRALAVAASITLILSILWIPNPLKSREMSYEEKAAALKEALIMISSAEKAETEQEIIYEDETIIIYTEK